MKTKTDVYTKIVLTVIAIALVGNLIKDVDFVDKAHANEFDLSALKMENASNANDQVFYIYENSRIEKPVIGDISGKIGSKDKPLYIITNKTGEISLY